MKRALLVAVAFASVAQAGTKFVGGGLQVGPTAPVLLPFANPSQIVHVSQILYTQVELGFAANTRIIDVAWRKEGLGPVTGAGGCAEQVWMKNVTRQMGPFTVGSTQPLTDALMNAQKVIDKPASMLPSTMGFVTLDVVENQFNFIYLGDALEVTIITDCRAAASPAIDAPITWRYDDVPERVRTVSGDTTDGLVLAAEPVLSSFRPHTRFRTLVDTPHIEVRIAGNVLPNGGNFGVAMNHFAAGQPAPFAFELVNDSKDPVTVMSVTASTQTGGTATVMAGPTPTTVMPGQSFPTPVLFVPTTAGVLARLGMTWVTSAGTQTNAFQGTPTATPMTQPSGALLKNDGSMQTLTAPTPTVVQVGSVPGGHRLPVTLVAQEFGQGPVEAHVDVLSGDATVARGSTMVGTQEDVRFETVVRAPAGPGTFTVELHLNVGANVYTVQVQGTVSPGPDIAVFVDTLEIPNAGEDVVLRADENETMRTYRVANVGQRNLYVDFSEVTTAEGAKTRYVLPRVLTPGSAANAVLTLPRYDGALEPFESFVLSDDPDETGFTWRTRSRFMNDGFGKLAVFVSGVGGNGDGARRGVAGDSTLKVVGDRVVVTLVNVGDGVLQIYDIAERGCDACGPLQLEPFNLAPGEERSFERPSPEDSEVKWFITTEPDGDFKFAFQRRKSACAMAPGPLVVGLFALWLARRRSRRS